MSTKRLSKRSIRALLSSAHPGNWPISCKIAAGPLIVVSLLGLVMVYGWSIADRHQRLIGEGYEEHAAYRDTALRIPHLLARIQKDLYKLTIWAQLNVQGEEMTSIETSIESNIDDVRAMLATLEEPRSAGPLNETIRRYGQGVEQALILIGRSPSVGATATRGVEHIYLDADKAANRLAATAEDLFDRRIEEMQTSWQHLIVRFLVMMGAVGIVVSVIALGSARMIAIPIRNLARVVDQFRNGELDVQVPWTRRRDEIGLVARAMESFRSNLIRNQLLEREREEFTQQLELKVDERTQELADQKERLAKALDKEHELNGLQRQFVSMVCHEFRTPLAIIDGNAQRMIRRQDKMPPDRARDALGKMRTAVTRLTELMESVLSASRLEAGVIRMEPVPCDLGELITEVAGNYEEVNTSYEIIADVDQLPALFTADPKLLRQVISNLVSNAVKYSPEGSQVHIEAWVCDDGGVKIAVTDQGVGIPAAELEKLFERFFRASTSVGIAGTGIGLHMVKALVDMHHGRIDVTSEEGNGTTFAVYLPLRDDPPIASDDEDGVVKAA